MRGSALTTQPDDIASGPGPAVAEDRPAGLSSQFGRTRAAFGRLARAHVDLLKAELGAILSLVGSMAGKAAAAAGLAALMGIMLYVGGLLFLGEWLFGSIGWGLAHGTLLPVALIVALGLGIVGGTRGPFLTSLLIVLVVIVALALLLGLNLLHETARYLSQQLVAPLDTPAAVGTLAGALILGLLLALLLWRVGGRGGALGGLVLGAVLGAILGFAATVDAWTWGPAVGLAIAIGLICWPILNLALTWSRLDMEAHFARLKPRQSQEAFAETKSWLEEQWRTRSPMPGKK